MLQMKIRDMLRQSVYISLLVFIVNVHLFPGTSGSILNNTAQTADTAVPEPFGVITTTRKNPQDSEFPLRQFSLLHRILRGAVDGYHGQGAGDPDTKRNIRKRFVDGQTSEGPDHEHSNDHRSKRYFQSPHQYGNSHPGYIGIPLQNTNVSLELVKNSSPYGQYPFEPRYAANGYMLPGYMLPQNPNSYGTGKVIVSQYPDVQGQPESIPYSYSHPCRYAPLKPVPIHGEEYKAFNKPDNRGGVQSEYWPGCPDGQGGNKPASYQSINQQVIGMGGYMQGYQEGISLRGNMPGGAMQGGSLGGNMPGGGQGGSFVISGEKEAGNQQQGVFGNGYSVVVINGGHAPVGGQGGNMQGAGQGGNMQSAGQGGSMQKAPIVLINVGEIEGDGSAKRPDKEMSGGEPGGDMACGSPGGDMPGGGTDGDMSGRSPGGKIPGADLSGNRPGCQEELIKKCFEQLRIISGKRCMAPPSYKQLLTLSVGVNSVDPNLFIDYKTKMCFNELVEKCSEEAYNCFLRAFSTYKESGLFCDA